MGNKGTVLLGKAWSLCKGRRVLRAWLAVLDKGHATLSLWLSLREEGKKGRREGGKEGRMEGRLACPVLLREGHGGERCGRRLL